MKAIIATGVVAALAAGAAAILPTAWHSPASAAIPPEPPAASAAAAPVPSSPVSAAALPDFSPLVERYGPAVVNISVKQTVRASASPMPELDEDHPLAPFFRGLPRVPRQPVFGEGSGFIVDPGGIILTNAHVVDEASEVTVTLTDRREFTAKVLGTDRLTDVAVLKIEATDLPTVKLGNPDELKVGQWVVAIGSPFGFRNSVTAGIVSAKGRSLPDETYVPFIQTDVAVNPGNSGGPLFNLKGAVVGVNSQIFSRTGGYQGVSFAIPIDVAMRVQKELVETGRVTRGWLGVGIQGMTRELAESFGLERPRGALVAQVQPDSPAEHAGVKVGDVILEFNGQPVDESGDLPPLVGGSEVGSKATLKVLRDGRERTLTVEIAQLADGSGSDRQDARRAERGGLGIAVADLTPEQRAELGLDKGGVLVTSVTEGPAAEAGIRRGDVLLRLGKTPINDAEHLRRLVAEAPKGKPIPILVRRGDTTIFVAVEPQARAG